MKIETKYKVGDRVMVKADPILTTTCPFCNGQGKLDVNGTVLYCQNCDDGVLKSRMMEGRQFVPGVIIGMSLDVRRMGADEDGFEDEDYTSIEENSCYGICEEYFVEVDSDKYWGDGTYHVRKIKPLKKEATQPS